MKKTLLSSYDNKWYHPGSKFKIVLWYIINLITINSSIPIPSSAKRRLLILFGAQIGKKFTIKPQVQIKYPWKLIVGHNVWIGENVWIDNLGSTIIEDNVCISQGAMLLSGNHDYTKSSFDLIVKDIKLEEGSWVGAKSIVCPGVTMFSHSILAVGSVANKNLSSYSVYQGNPAIKIRERKIRE
ncbi:WcaF family extracellular polysaccharide biosynthesis acetyltransferase [Salegentibacter mishustinae]|uniref:Acyl transferase n=1 Tax=Salegentibacter mishustinae TaxID=270918 RepID=A0A0Q9ZND5_9FLAO|nr:WcaF family extracellular polysaccharide biosynthesis acetyltransferase [Salegentibacter mishustinae]KRG30830.1 acyl transferase [Salegentibacter mishustinae]PNW23721.1 acyl transferase [Salegentibacter mishustinae]GGW83484.1 colanic acid biosynthesis acetyltransferase WcaF [Salegentibacter mishustinae]